MSDDDRVARDSGGAMDDVKDSSCLEAGMCTGVGSDGGLGNNPAFFQTRYGRELVCFSYHLFIAIEYLYSLRSNRFLVYYHTNTIQIACKPHSFV